MFIMDCLWAARVIFLAAVRCSAARDRCPGSGANLTVAVNTALVNLCRVLACRERQTRNASVLFPVWELFIDRWQFVNLHVMVQRTSDASAVAITSKHGCLYDDRPEGAVDDDPPPLAWFW